MRKKLTCLLMLLTLLCGAVSADQENLITISANGVRTTYAFDSFRSATIADPYADVLTMNVNFNDGTNTVSNVHTLIREIVPDEPQEEVEVKTSDSTATFTWPAVPDAVTYQLIIYKNFITGERFCTLTFNSRGQLINIDFNPAGPSTKVAQTIFNFTVTGLEKGKQYQYEMSALGSAEQELEKTTGSFETGTTDADETSENDIDVYTRNKIIVVDCDKESSITFFDTMGRQVGDCLHTQHCECTVTLTGIYIVLVDGKQYKVRID